MPIVSVERDKLLTLLDYDPLTYTDHEFEILCFEFGIELDDVTTERQMQIKKMVKSDALEEETKDLSDEVLYKIDVPANRYDLLCMEGIVTALRVFLGKDRVPEFVVDRPNNMLKMSVKCETKQIREFVVCAVLRNVTFTEDSYKSFIDLQEKLHQNICRRRTLVAIGTHDLDTIQAPFTYEARTPDNIKFQPLYEEREFTAEELFRYYYEEKKQSSVKPYLSIIEHSPVYPCIYDSHPRVLSLPPIINGDHSKITLNTKNVFIECTATDYTKANIVLNTVVAMFSRYCERPGHCEAVEVTYEDTGRVEITPSMQSVKFETSPKYLWQGIGVKIETPRICELLEKMQLITVWDQEKDILCVTAPPTRSDILHACDIQEDVAIGYGYNNIPKTIPNTTTVGREQPLNKLSDQLRNCVAQAGYLETLTFVLCSHKETFEWLRREDDGRTAVVLDNPVSDAFDVARCSLLVGVLITLKNNWGKVNLPIRTFELSDVVLLDDSTEVGARNERRLAALCCNRDESGLEQIHGLVDRVFALNDCILLVDLEESVAAQRDAVQAQTKLVASWKKKSKKGKDKVRAQLEHTKADGELKRMQASLEGAERRLQSRTRVYWSEPSNDPTFFPRRQVHVHLGDGNGGSRIVGGFGIIHPQVLKAYNIPFPASAVEINIEPFV